MEYRLTFYLLAASLLSSLTSAHMLGYGYNNYCVADQYYDQPSPVQMGNYPSLPHPDVHGYGPQAPQQAE